MKPTNDLDIETLELLEDLLQDYTGTLAATQQQPTPPAPPTAAERAKAADNLRKAKVQLVIQHPFFASIVLKRTIDIRDDVPTAYVTPTGKIVMGTAFLAKQTVQTTMGLLAHETMHYAMMHHMRVGWRKPRVANKYMDFVINDILKAAGMELPEGGAFQDGAREYAWEQLYKEDEDEGGEGPYTPGHGNDDLSAEGINDVMPEQIEQVKQELSQALSVAKNKGNIPAGMERLINDIINPRTPWFQLLERYMTHLIRSGQSWRRPNKRFACHDIYMPTHDKTPHIGTLVIESDESGSIDVVTTTHWNGHINRIIELCRPERVIVLHTDTVVAKAEEFEADDYPIAFKTYAAGGTDMTAGFRWCVDNGVEPDVFVCLTDGYTPFGEAPGYPVVWLITTRDIEAPHGETIYYEVRED
jgi:predicted metal-dependent peptidase